jgi:hypothetical protein
MVSSFLLDRVTTSYESTPNVEAAKRRRVQQGHESQGEGYTRCNQGGGMDGREVVKEADEEMWRARQIEQRRIRLQNAASCWSLPKVGHLFFI